NISGGEHEYTIHGFRDALDLKAFDIAQFDVNRVGGITAAKKIADMCEANDFLVIPHAGQMHNYHITMSSYAGPISEYFPKVPVEVGNELFWYVFDGEPVAKDGFIDLSDTAPGFGLTPKPVDANFKADPLMPNFPIIDTHLHVWDQTRLKYSAFEGSELFGHPYHVEDYRRDCGKLDIEAMGFLECYADFGEGGGQYIEEIEFVESEQKRDPRIKAIIPMAPVESGKRVEPMLVKMRDEHPSVRGIRRIMEFDRDPRGLTLSPGFIEGVNLLERFGWSFDINPNHTQMDFIREWVPRISSGVPMILDHCGKPGIKQGAIAQYREDVKNLARYPNMWIKLSDLPPYAGPNWTEADLRPYIEATLETFGPERTIYAGDYPILLQATNMT